MEQARTVDRLTLIVVLIYVVGYAFLYGLVYQCLQINRQCGCFRPWTRGKSIGNTPRKEYRQHAIRPGSGPGLAALYE